MFEPGIERMMDGSVFTRERPVFVAADNLRARRLCYGGGAAVLFACLWVAALAVGMLGTGGLPGVSFPSGVRGAEHGVREQAPAKGKPASERSRAVVAKPPTPYLEPRVATRNEPVRHARKSSANPARRATPIRARSVAESAPPAEAAAAPPVTQPAPPPVPPPPKQGWARQGYAAPPGEIRRIEAQEPAAPQAPAPAQPQPAPAPPGQQKKAEDPNPKG
jgi:hypothetical protein